MYFAQFKRICVATKTMLVLNTSFGYLSFKDIRNYHLVRFIYFLPFPVHISMNDIAIYVLKNLLAYNESIIKENIYEFGIVQKVDHAVTIAVRI